MAAENIVPLVSLSGFKGLNTSEAQPYLEAGEAITSSNCNPTIIRGALLPERGRVPFNDFSSTAGDVTTVFPVVAASYTPYYLIQTAGIPPSVPPLTFLFNPFTLQSTLLSNALTFTQAVQYGSVVYTNAGQRLFLATVASNALTTTFYDWQYPAPPTFVGTYTVSAGPNPSLAIGTYWYIFTRQTVMPDGTISETSVNLDEYAGNASIAAGTAVTTANSQISITPTAFAFTGTNSDGTTFTTNIYRQSTNQAGYYYVGNVPANGPYIDNLPDNEIIANVMLEVHRDPPPVSATNLGWLCIHKNSVWCFVDYAEPLDDFTPAQVQTQCQIWYSEPGRPWEFDNSSQVLLADSDVTSPVVSEASSGDYAYGELYGNAPRGMAEIGTVLLCFKQREMWAVLGDSSTNFVTRTYFEIGCIAPQSITPVYGGCYWLSESTDVYYFDGSSPSDLDSDVRTLFHPVPGFAGVNPFDAEQATGFFANDTFYLAFPTLQQTFGYSISQKVWTSILPYAPASPAAVAYVPANPNQYQAPATRVTGTSVNEVVAGRSGNPGMLDWWFVDPDNDLGAPQTFSWTGGLNASKTFGEHQYSYVTIFAPPSQQGTAIVTVQVDDQTPIVLTFDLSLPPRQLQKPIGTDGGLVRGFMASLSISVTGVVGQPAPQIWDVSLWGQQPSDRKLNLRV